MAQITKETARKALSTVFAVYHVDAWLDKIKVVPKDYVAEFVKYINSLDQIKEH